MNNSTNSSDENDPTGSKSTPKTLLAKEEIKQLAELRVLAVDHEMANEQIENDKMFTINFKGHIVDNLPANSIRIFLHRHPEISREIAIKKMYSSDSWIPLLDHENFQDKSSFNLEAIGKNDHSNYFHILKNGQKKGPHTIKEMAQMLKNYELIVTDLISSDGGRTWKKLASLEEFDRRAFNRETLLPIRPKFKYFTEDKQESVNDSKEIDPLPEGHDPLLELAHLGMSTDKKNQEEDSFINDMEFVNESKNYKYLFVLVAFFVGGIIFSLDQSSNINKEKTTKVAAKKESASKQDKASPSKKKTKTLSKIKARPQIKKRTTTPLLKNRRISRPQRKAFNNANISPRTPPIERDEKYNPRLKRPTVPVSKRRRAPRKTPLPYDEDIAYGEEDEDYDDEYQSEEEEYNRSVLRRRRRLREYLDDPDE